MRKLIREPLLHFLLLGLALFLLFNFVSGGRGGADRRIVVNDATVASIVQRYQSTWQRPPTPSELRGLIDSQVREEIMFREGASMGLDRDDPVIRRRVQQKLDVIAEESAVRSAPSDADLTIYLGQHAEKYSRPAVIGFDQVMVDPVRHGTRLDDDIATALARLRAGAKPETIGDSTLLPATTIAIAADRLAGDFGEDFARSMLELPAGDWSGPVRSAYGVHLVRVNTNAPGRPATLDEVRAAVERDWENDRRVRANDDYYAKLRKKYEISIEVALPETAQGNAGN